MNSNSSHHNATNIPPTILTVYLEAVGLFAPSMPNWQAGQALLSSAVNTPNKFTTSLEVLSVPAPTVLPPAERRRVGTGVKLALAAGLDALQSFVGHGADSTKATQATHEAAAIDAGSLFQTVFTSSGGDGDNCHAMCEALAEPDRAISPTRFTNSVHNASSGYWGIALRAKPASTSICAFDGSFSAGFLDAVTQVHTQQTSVLLVSYDTPYPFPLNLTRPIQDHFSAALLLSPHRSHRSIAKLDIALSQAPASRLDPAPLESLRCGNPTGRVLPLLAMLALKQHGELVLDYLPQCNIALQLNCYAA